MKNLMYFAQHVFGKRIGICLVFSLVLLIGPAEAYESFTTSVEAYQGFTISSGMSTLDDTVITIIIGTAEEISAISAPNIEPLFDFSPPVDILFGLTTEPNHPIEVVAEKIAGIGVLEDTAFGDVTDDLLATLDFTERTVTIDSNDIVVLLLNQDQEEYAMLSNITKYPDATVSFTYWKSEIPEVSTLVLLGVGIVGLFGIIRWRQHNRSRKGGRSMKQIKTLLFVFVLLPLLVGTATAAEVELRVIRIGSGDGFVMGEDIWCGDECKRSYKKGTVVQLKAEPDPDSTFVGWLINDQPHEGIVTIDQDTIVKAIFELKIGRNLDIYWYNGDTKRRATMVLDEVAIFIEPWEQWEVSTQAEAIAAAQKIAQRFHPQAVVSEQYEDYLLLVKSPEPVEKEQLPDILFSLKELKYVRQASPVFYINPAYPSSQLILTDEIYVRFPDKYTKDQIAAIEAEYSLVLVEAISYVPNGFRYRVSDPLEALDVANRLYESGLVEVSFPEMVEEYTLDSRPNDIYFGDQWHLENTGQSGGVAGEDVNILPAWNTWNPDQGKYARGSGVVIAIVDNGVEVNHEDLAPNVRRDLCYDFIDGDTDPSPVLTAFIVVPFDPSQIPIEKLKAKHGTAVAGVTAASCFLPSHNKGVCGSAPDSEIAGYRAHIKGVSEKLVGNPHLKGKPGNNANALVQFHQDVHIYNNSWGSDFILLDPLKDYEEIALISGIIDGRHGLGSIFVFSGGNMNRMFLGGQWTPDGSNSNYVGFKNSRYTIAVAASDNEGEQSLYSTPGANILVNAPSSDGWAGGASISTTDRSGLEGYNPYDDANGTDYPNFNYTNSFGGTSAAAPLLSGIIALILQVNSTLSWRDVQHILIETAEKNDPTDDDWIDNAAGHHFNHKYGAGRVDAKAAVDAALTWKNVADEVETSPKGLSKDTIEITDNIQIEFVEVTLRTPHHFREDLTVVLFSPHGTHSVLGEPHPTLSGIEHYDNWRFGSVRHFGESSKGEWNLVLVDKKTGDPVTTRFFWKIQFYGTALSVPYVKTVEARSGDELIYSAEWVVEENGQLEFVEHVEPKNPSADHPLSIKIVTSESMGWISLNLFDQDFSSDSTNPTRTIQQADDSGTLWEVMIDPADFPQEDVGNENTLSNVYLLTFTGQDTVGTSLLPFADRTPKILPTHPSDPDWPAYPNAGDTVHLIGNILSAPFTWSIITPTESTCKQNRGGIVCAFDDGNTETVGRGSVALLPKDIPTPPEEVPQYVVPVPTDEAGLTHHGIYQLPEEGLKVAVQPQANWFPPCTPDDPQEARCPWSEDYEHKPAPPDSEETKTLSWTVETDIDDDQNRCQVQVTWDSETASVFLLTEHALEQLHTTDIPKEILEGLQSLRDQPFPTPDALWKVVTARITHDDLAQYHDQIMSHVEQQKAVTTIELQPSTLCERMTGARSGILNATATCTWNVQRMLDYQWKEMGPFDKLTGYGKNMKHYHRCHSFYWLLGGGALMKYDCQEDPHWQQDPEPQTFELIPPGEQGFLPTQLMEVTYRDCQWKDWEFWDWWMKIGTRWYWYTEIACLESGDCHRQRMGQSTCQAQETYFQWKGVSNCEYAKTLGHVAYPDGALEVILLPEPQ